MELHFSIFMIPPFLCLFIGITLAIISVVKGKLNLDNILFSLSCIWMSSLLSPAFLAHFFISDLDVILKIERSIHFFYVFIGFVTIIFYHRILGVRRRWLEILILIISIGFAASTQTQYYLTGLYSYNWGHIAKGGPAFLAFGAYGIFAMIYGITLCILRLRTETNKITRSKIKYILFSLNVMIILTSLNIPAMNGIDFYPFGNFMFVPLLVMAFGVLRYRLLDIKSIAHLTFFWMVLSSLFLIPNIIVFKYLEPTIRSTGQLSLIGIVAAWFFVNVEYLRWIQPRIDKIFNRHKMNLMAAEAKFIEEVTLLKSLEGLLTQFKATLMKTLHISGAEVYLKDRNTTFFRNAGGKTLEISQEILDWFRMTNHIIEENMVQTNPDYASVKVPLGKLFVTTGFPIIVPLIQNDEFLGMLLLAEKASLKSLSADEIRFINNIRSAATISLSNSVMYQNLSDIKDNLEDMVQERTKELKTKNDQMLFELKVAKQVQMAIIPNDLPVTSSIKMAAKMLPLMEVSGDFYEVIQVNDRIVATAVIDVSGHGIPAALLTSMIKSEIEIQIKKHTRTNDICSAINLSLYPVLVETGFYFTMFLCLLDLKTMVMEFTNCGHTEPLLFSDGKFMKLNSDGFFIGMSPESRYGSRRIQLKQRDRVFLYTDGVTEARSAENEEYGDTRFMKTIAKTSVLSVTEQVTAIMSSVDSFRDKSAMSKKDDITLLAFETGTELA